MQEFKNSGIIDILPRITDYFFKKGTKISPKTVVRNNGQWDDVLPTEEHQKSKIFDTMACVSYSALNCTEMLYAAVYDVQKNFSDRFTAKMSGTTRQGNWFVKVGDSIRKDGLVSEVDYRYLVDQFDWHDYYAPVPKDVKEQGKNFLKDHKIMYEWVIWSPDNFEEALQFAPLQVSVFAWGQEKNGIYQNGGQKQNHAVTVFGYEYGKCWHVFDQYPPFIKKVDWNFNFGRYAVKYYLESARHPVTLGEVIKRFADSFRYDYDLRIIRNSETNEWGWYYNNAVRIAESQDRKIELIASILMRTGHLNLPSVSVNAKRWAELPKIKF